MQFYLQSSIAEKGIKKEDYAASRLDVVIGCLITDVISFFIIVTCGALLFPNGIRINEAAEAALALKPLAGQYAYLIFAICLANASLLGASYYRWQQHTISARPWGGRQASINRLKRPLSSCGSIR